MVTNFPYFCTGEFADLLPATPRLIITIRSAAALMFYFVQGEPVSLSEALDSMCVTYSPTTKRLHKTTDSPRTPPPPSASHDLSEEKLKDRLKDECEYSPNSRKLRSSPFFLFLWKVKCCFKFAKAWVGWYILPVFRIRILLGLPDSDGFPTQI